MKKLTTPDVNKRILKALNKSNMICRIDLLMYSIKLSEVTVFCSDNGISYGADLSSGFLFFKDSDNNVLTYEQLLIMLK